MARGGMVPDTDVWGEDLGEPRRFVAFYREALPVVYGYLVRRCGGGPSLAEDLTQETFLAAVRGLRAGTVVDAPLPWIVGIARKKLIDHFRRQERADRKLTLAWDAGRIDDEGLWDAPSDERALSALSAVAPAQRAALTLRYLDGLSVEEVAGVLGRSVHATESLLARGRDRFKRAYLEADDA